MEHSRKPSEQEINEIIADVVRLYRLDKNMIPILQEMGEVVSVDEEVRFHLSKAIIIISDMDIKGGFIFWGGEGPAYPSILIENALGKLCLISEKHIDKMYWGTSGA